uniref:Uncharacterized protein n=1 Tax=Anguilla anguilla TaxID=7936 RepID=A0A0E9PC75_ANGAN
MLNAHCQVIGGASWLEPCVLSSVYFYLEITSSQTTINV